MWPPIMKNGNCVAQLYTLTATLYFVVYCSILGLNTPTYAYYSILCICSMLSQPFFALPTIPYLDYYSILRCLLLNTQLYYFTAFQLLQPMPAIPLFASASCLAYYSAHFPLFYTLTTILYFVDYCSILSLLFHSVPTIQF